MFRFVLCVFVAVAAAVPLQHEQEHHYAPGYTYKYEVEDPHTHDFKTQYETKHGDKVEGMYSLVEPDGALRIVKYAADGHNGFRAVVTREKHGHREVTVHGKKEYEIVPQVQNNLVGEYGAVSQAQNNLGGGYRAVSQGQNNLRGVYGEQIRGVGNIRGAGLAVGGPAGTGFSFQNQQNYG